MSASLLVNPTLLEQLKVKQPPKLLKQVRVVMPKEAVIIKTKIVDKTAAAFDRANFLEGIIGIQKLKKKEHSKERAIADEQPALVEHVASPKPKKRKLKLKLKPKKTQGDIDELAVLGELAPKKKLARRTQKPIGIIQEGPASMLKIGDATLATRFSTRDEQESKKEYIRASSYYMNNREIFVNFMSSLFGPYKKELQDEAGKATCDRDEDQPFSPMTHQKIVRDYLNLYTPYRGLLLFHGLGSGKTCSSIAIAEGMKTSKPVIVMTPASLRMIILRN